MYKSKKTSLLFAATLMMASSIASASHTVNSYPGLYFMLGSGASFSENADISANPFYWDASPQGYNASLGTSALYTFGVGYQFTPFVSVDVDFTSRPSYSYNKFQTSAAADTSGFIGEKTRQFDLMNNSLMANIVLSGQGVNLFAPLGNCAILQPFIGAGIGIAYNTLSNFHSVLATSDTPGSQNVASIMNDITHTSFAWQVKAGLELLHAEHWGIDLGYRYFDGGVFKSNNYLIDGPGAVVEPFTIAAWSGKLRANEVFLNLKYMLV